MPRLNRYYSGPPSDHYDGRLFFNPGEPDTDRSIAQVLRWKIARGAAPWPHHVAVDQVVPDSSVARLRVTMVGHATLLIQVAGRNILTDPVFAERASPLRSAGPRRVTAPGIAFDRLPAIDTVLLSHNHYDHLDMATLQRLHERDAPLIVTPLGNDAIIHRSIPAARVRTADWGQHVDIGAGAEVHIVPANHWSSRGLFDRRMALWSGFMLRAGGTLVYFAGDTGYGTGQIFRQMRADFGAPDLALLPIGAYAPEWFMAAQHCNPEEAVSIMVDLNARHALGIHWGCFQLTDEDRMEPVDRLSAAICARGLDETKFSAATPGMIWQA